MIDQIYFFLHRIQKKRRESNKKTNCIAAKILEWIEVYYNILFKKYYSTHSITKSGVCKEMRMQKIIISLTSIPNRIDTVWLTIETLMHQSVKPDEIILWIAESQFSGFETLPETLKMQCERGLKIRFCKDLKSHKKYFYVMQEYPEDIVVLVDDDMFYPRDMLENLLEMHHKYPSDVCTSTAQYIPNMMNTMPSSWRNPFLGERFVHSDKIQIFSGSGSLYPPHCLDVMVFDEDLILELCPYADDLWLTYMAYRKGTRITASYPWRAFPVTIYNTARDSLYYINAEGGKNDEQWKNIVNRLESL